MTSLGLATTDYAAGRAGLSLVDAAGRGKRSGASRWRRRAGEVIDGQGGQCLICGGRAALTCHHVLALRDGGTDVRENLIALCASDHTTLHIVERSIPFASRLLLAVVVIFGPSRPVCRFLRLAFPLLVRRGNGFHPAGLRLRRLAASTTCTAVLACMFAAAAFAQAPPSPDTILVVQELRAHERAEADRIAYQVAKQLPRAVAEPDTPRRRLSTMEMRELSEALERYFRVKGARIPVFWSPEGRHD